MSDRHQVTIYVRASMILSWAQVLLAMALNWQEPIHHIKEVIMVFHKGNLICNIRAPIHTGERLCSMLFIRTHFIPTQSGGTEVMEGIAAVS